MLTTRLNGLLFIVFTLACLNVSRAQDANAALNQALGSIQPATGTTPPATTPATTAPTPAVPGTPGTSVAPPTSLGPKYIEYQSICRINEFDRIKDFPQELKDKRIEAVNAKIEEAKEPSIKNKYLLRLIKELLDQGEKEKIKPTVKTLKSMKISDAENAQLNALIAVSEENYASARDTLNKFALIEKNNIDLLSFLADVYMKLENYYEATTIYEDLDRMTQNNYLVQLCEATVLNLLNADGEKICLQAAAKFPNSPIPHIYIGIAHREREDFVKAAGAFKKSITVKPTEMATSCLAEVFYIKLNFKDAITLFKRSLDINPRSGRATMGLAFAQLKLKQYDEALDTLKRACKTNNKYETEVRKIYKNLTDDKISESPKFRSLADTCAKY